MNMTNASDEDQLATRLEEEELLREGFTNTADCPGCQLLRAELRLANMPTDDRLTAAEAHRIAMRTLLRAEAERSPKRRRRWTQWMWRLFWRAGKARK